ncbi:MAG: hypothetical protein KAI43_10380 [Candidatus Aureabacteria bacterium]|nr:hypothetical protein [Candidatus Auribacterota bacterium]
MKRIIVNPGTVFITLFAYFIVGITIPVAGAPIQSKVEVNKQEFLQVFEKDLAKTGLSQQEIQQRFQGLTNKDIIALYSGLKADTAGSGDPALEALGMLLVLLLISASIGALAQESKSTSTYR